MSEASSYKFYDTSHAIDDVTETLLDGLSASPKYIEPKFFYDKKGSELFTQITRTPEYYPTQTEIGILKAYGSEMAECIGRDSVLIEYGAGNGEKIRLLLDSLKPALYAPLDISSEYLDISANAIAEEYPWLEVHATCVDYNHAFQLPFDTGDRPVAGFFPGSSIGNFEPRAAVAFLKRVKQQLGLSSGLLVGIDLKKDSEVLNLAYNDANGITEAFNLNVLSHLNQVYGADFDLEHFEHKAEYNEDLGCIQMFLESQKQHRVQLAGRVLEFSEGEQIHTENSFKYSQAEFVAMAKTAGFNTSRCWTDDKQWFAVFYLC